MSKDYKKLYEEALKRAKYLKENTDSVGAKDISYNFEYIFPELRESEDEQHRKWILEYLYDGLQKSDEQFKDQFNSAIAWLEKQVEYKSLSTEETELNSLAFLTELGYTCIPPTKENHKWSEEDKKIRKELHKYFHDLQLSSDREFSPSTSIDEILDWLEKQDKQIKDNKEEIIYLKEKNMDYSSEIIGFLKNYIKAYGCTAMNSWVNWLEEQCHGGKKWIYEDTYIKDKEQTFQDGIYEVLENPQKYGLEKQQDNNEDSNVLQRFSFYSYKDEPNILYLSGLYVNKECRNKGIGTKILEVAHEVAKSLNCHAIRLKTRKDSNAERLYRAHGYNSLATEERDEIWLEKQCEKRYTWSEEDEKIYQSILDDTVTETQLDDKQITWLKSLKDRVQPTQEWSKEDDNEVAILTAYIRGNDWSEKHITRALGIVDELVNKVKSIKPNHWRPSEEQLRAIINSAQGLYQCKEKEVLLDLYEQLKNL